MVRTGMAVLALAVATGACGARDVPAKDVGKACPCVDPPATPVCASAPVVAAPAPPSATPPGPEATPLPDEYGTCHVVRRADSGALDPKELAAARAGGWLWPPTCGEVSGWAGIGMALSGQATAFSAKGDRFVACGAWEDECDVVDLSRDGIVQRVTSARPDGIDGSPITGTPVVKKLFQRLGAPAPEGRFPYPDDVRVSWKVADGGGALYVTLVLLATGDERVVHRFPDRAVSSAQPIVLRGAHLSPDGRILEVDVFTGQGGSGYEVALVNLHAEAAALFRAAAGADPGAWTKKADRADEKARTAARRFIE